MKFENSETMKNLARAFAGECQEGARYQFIAQKAMDEDYPYINTLLKGIAKNEMNHAKAFYDCITNHTKDNIQRSIEICASYPFKHGTLVENLKDSYENEEAEKNIVYPGFSKIANDEGFPEIAKLFDLVTSVENCHYLLVKELYTKLSKNNLYKSNKPTKWKCGACGFEHTEKTPWQICPLCAKNQGNVMIEISDGSK